MKIIGKITAAVTAAVMGSAAFAAGGINVSAYADDTLYKAAGFSAKDIELAEKIKKYLQDRENKPMDISAYDLSFEEFEDLYVTVLFGEPSLFYVSPISSYLSYDTMDHINTFAPVYNYTKSRTASISEMLDEYTEKLLSGVEDDWSDTEKVLYVHDYIAAHAKYYEGSNIYTGRNISDLFLKETSVCVGYAMGFQYIMDIMGIPCISVTNDDHIWNMVQIDSNWYHLDITWDDSLDASPNFVFHRMMLLSEYGLDNTEPVHDPWDFGMTADSNEYDDFFWQDSCSAMAYLDGYWYYSTIDGICRYSFDTDEAQLVCSIDDSWHAEGNRKWIVSFAKVQAYDGEIYFNTPYKVYRYSPVTNKVNEFYAPQLRKGYQIYDFIVEDGKLTLYSSDSFEDMDKEIGYVNFTKHTAVKEEKPAESPNAPGVTERKGVISISWEEDPSAEQYVIYRYNKETKKIVQIGTSIDGTFSFKKTDRDENCLYAVKPRFADGLGEYSPWAGV